MLSCSLSPFFAWSFTHFTALLYPKHGKYVVVCVLNMVSGTAAAAAAAARVFYFSPSSSFIFKYSNERKREDKGVQNRQRQLH